LTVNAGTWPSDEDPEEEFFDELIWSVMEERPARQLLTAEQVSIEHEHAPDGFDENDRVDSSWLSHVRMLHRDECHEPARLIDRWMPAGFVPLGMLRDKDLGEILDWISENRSDSAPWRVSETIRIHRPFEDDRILMELLDTGEIVIAHAQHYYAKDDDLLLIDYSLLTTQHLLSYERNLEWERVLESGEPFDAE